jgi:hypothetical protein
MAELASDADSTVSGLMIVTGTLPHEPPGPSQYVMTGQLWILPSEQLPHGLALRLRETNPQSQRQSRRQRLPEKGTPLRRSSVRSGHLPVVQALWQSPRVDLHLEGSYLSLCCSFFECQAARVLAAACSAPNASFAGDTQCTDYLKGPRAARQQ